MLIFLFLRTIIATLITHAPMDSLTICDGVVGAQCTTILGKMPQSHITDGARAGFFDNRPHESPGKVVQIQDIAWQDIVDSQQLTLSVWFKADIQIHESC